MSIDVNSDKWAKRFLKIVRDQLGSAAVYQSTTFEPRATAPETCDSSFNKEVIKMNQAHWANWVHEPVPALGGKTPLKAAITPEGREMLLALLTQFEHQAVNHPVLGVSVETFKNIRTLLKLPMGPGI